MRFAPAHLGPFALLMVAASAAEAQYLHGRVVDKDSGEPVASAAVLVVNPDESIRAGAITDGDGRFALRTSAGTFHLRVQRVGYATTGSVPLELARSDTLDFEVKLPEAAVDIDPLTITAESRGPRDPSGFLRRQSEIAGRFLGPYEVERRHPLSPADLLHDIPGYTVVPRTGGFRVLMTGRNRRCVPTVYVDGLLAHRGTQTDRSVQASEDDGVMLEPLVNANAIRALEAYQSGATAPVRFRPVGPIGGGDCGVLVFWTRIGFGR